VKRRSCVAKPQSSLRPPTAESGVAAPLANTCARRHHDGCPSAHRAASGSGDRNGCVAASRGLRHDGPLSSGELIRATSSPTSASHGVFLGLRRIAVLYINSDCGTQPKTCSPPLLTHGEARSSAPKVISPTKRTFVRRLCASATRPVTAASATAAARCQSHRCRSHRCRSHRVGFADAENRRLSAPSAPSPIAASGPRQPACPRQDWAGRRGAATLLLSGDPGR
jgi:hypothetical protein